MSEIDHGSIDIPDGFRFVPVPEIQDAYVGDVMVSPSGGRYTLMSRTPPHGADRLMLRNEATGEITMVMEDDHWAASLKNADRAGYRSPPYLVPVEPPLVKIEGVLHIGGPARESLLASWRRWLKSLNWRGPPWM